MFSGGGVSLEKALLLFSPASVLDEERVRRAALRVPEVTIPLKAAQKFLDRFSPLELDLINLAGGSSEEFQAQTLARPLVLALMQWGLYQRLMSRTSHRFDWLVGETGDQSVMNLVLERVTLSEFLWQSPALESTETQVGLPKPSVSASKFQIFSLQIDPGESEPVFRELGDPSADRWSLVESCISRLGAERVVTVGPATDFSEGLLKQRRLMEFDLVESVELDPQLHWFWADSRRPQTL